MKAVSKGLWLTCLLSAAGVAVAAAASEPVGYKGLRLGQPKEALLAQYPVLECKPGGNWRFAEEICEPRSLTSSDCVGGCKELLTYAGAPSVAHQFYILNGRFEGFYLRASVNRYEQVQAALKAAYPRGVETKRMMQQGTGRQFESRVWAAATDGATITASEHARNIDSSSVQGTSRTLQAWRDTPAVGNVSENKKDL